MIAKIVLCVFPNRMTAACWRAGRMAQCSSFSRDEAGISGFRQFLAAHRNVAVYLIADAVEEDYRLETLPHTVGAARRALVERRLTQLYRNSVYRAAAHVGRVQEKRRDDLFLFCALNNAELLTPWLTEIEQQQAPLAGVYLLPMVSQFLVNSLKLAEPHLLLVDMQASGLRQTYFLQGRLRVSRLAPSNALSPALAAKLYISETEKTRLYLLSQRYIARESKLTLLLLAETEQGEALSRQISIDQSLNCITLDPRDLAKRLRIDPAAVREHPELLYMQLVASGQAPVNLAPSLQTHTYQLRWLRRAIGSSAGLILLAGVSFSAHNLYAAYVSQSQTEAARLETALKDRQYAEVARNFPATPQSGDALKVAVDLAQTLVAYHATPQRLMRVTADALGASPEVQLQRLRWKLTHDLNSTDDSGPNTAGGAPANAATPHAPGEGLHEIGFIDGEIRNFNGDYRTALERVNRLAERLRKDARVEQVSIVQQPVNVSSLSSLQGSTVEVQAQQAAAAQFKLKLVLKPQGKS